YYVRGELSTVPFMGSSGIIPAPWDTANTTSRSPNPDKSTISGDEFMPSCSISSCALCTPSVMGLNESATGIPREGFDCTIFAGRTSCEGCEPADIPG